MTESRRVPASELNRISRAGHRRAAELEAKLSCILEPILRSAGRDAAAAFMKRATDHLNAAAEPPQWTAPAPDEMLDVHSLAESIRTKTDPVRIAFIERMMTETLDLAGLSFDVSNPFTRKVLEQTGSQIIGIAKSTQHRVMRIVWASYDEGLSIPDTAKAIRVGMAGASMSRARTIARSEIVSAANGGSLAAVQLVAVATGTTYSKVWMTASGAKHPRHALYPGLDRQSVSLDAMFAVGGYSLEYPGDPNGPASETVSCRCALEYAESSDRA